LRSPHKKQVWATLGSADVLDIDEVKARTAIQRIKDGLSAFETPCPQPVRRRSKRRGRRFGQVPLELS